LAWVVHGVPPGALRQDVAQFRHIHVGTVLLDQPLRMVLAYSLAFLALDADEGERPLSQYPCAASDHRFSGVNQTPTPSSVKFMLRKYGF
jgi:hypothetical protein